MKKTLIAGALGGAVLFLWGFVYWATLHVPQGTMHTFANEEEVGAALLAANPVAGVYSLPGFMKPSPADVEMYAGAETEMRSEEDLMRKMKEGPYGTIILVPGGVDFASQLAVDLPLGFLLDFLAAALVAWVVMAAGAGAGFGKRWAMAASFGVVAALIGPLIAANYMAWPMDYTGALAFDHVAGWILAGLAIAAATKPATAS